MFHLVKFLFGREVKFFFSILTDINFGQKSFNKTQLQKVKQDFVKLIGTDRRREERVILMKTKNKQSRRKSEHFLCALTF